MEANRFTNGSSLPLSVLKKIQEAAEIAARGKINLYLVGGFVRDLLLNVENLDLDFVVEGDGIQFARTLAKEWNATLRVHEKFGTAVLYFPREKKIDVATARAEYYPHPAALPEVTGSSIRQDLYRRDFTINAMAIQLFLSKFGELIDFFGGESDLRNKALRILHDLSFVDDPTRIFRAIRFEQRYRLRMDSRTEKLLTQAIHSKQIQNLTVERVREEIKLILSEARPLPAIQRMDRLRLLPLLHPKLKLSRNVTELLKNIPKVLAGADAWRFPEPPQKWILYGIAIFSGLDGKQVHELLEKFKFSNAEKEKFSLLLRNWKKILRNLGLSKTIPPSRIAGLLEGISPEGILFLFAAIKTAPGKKRIKQYACRSSKIQPLVNGEDLIQLGVSPGPAYKQWLEKIKIAQLDGIVKTKEQALAFLRKKLTPIK